VWELISLEMLTASVVTKALDVKTETKTEAAGFETESKTKAVASETEASFQRLRYTHKAITLAYKPPG